jgi:hypothetical protein
VRNKLGIDTSYDEEYYGEDEYECPLCHAVLFKDEDEATVFLSA